MLFIYAVFSIDAIHFNIFSIFNFIQLYYMLHSIQFFIFYQGSPNALPLLLIFII
jgi:hypothetical protein